MKSIKTLTIGAISALALSAALAQAHNGFHLVSSKIRSVTAASLAKEEKTSSSMRLVIRTGPKNDMMSFRIKGKRNPTLTVKHGATLRVLFVNSDDDMKHNVRFMATRPPFATDVSNAGSVGSDALAPLSGKIFHAEELVLKAPENAGTFSYVCTVKGHAAAGMYGTIIVK